MKKWHLFSFSHVIFACDCTRAMHGLHLRLICHVLSSVTLCLCVEAKWFVAPDF